MDCNRRGGFGLVEILVALAIGMLAIIVTLQSYTVFESRKRSATSGSDAQTNGAAALQMIERETRMAGWGLNSSIFGSCDPAAMHTYCDGSEACGGAKGALSNFSFGSLRIVDGGADPDAIFIQYFADPNLSTFRYSGSTTIRRSMPQPSSELDVASVQGCKAGDLMIAAQNGNCTLMQITHVQAGPLKLQHNPGSNGIYNPSASEQKDWPAYTAGAKLTCISHPRKAATSQKAYAIDPAARRLLKSDNTVDPQANNEPVVPDILDLQAQYGITGSATGNVVAKWVDATGAWANPDSAAQKQIKAVRIALVARSRQFEKPESGKPCSDNDPATQATTADAAARWSSWARFNTTNYPKDWRCYRYKVFETVVPLRNLIWAAP